MPSLITSPVVLHSKSSQSAIHAIIKFDLKVILTPVKYLLKKSHACGEGKAYPGVISLQAAKHSSVIVVLTFAF